MSESSKTTPTPKVPATPAEILEGDDAPQNPADTSFALRILIDLKERFGSIDERTSNLRGDVAGLRGDVAGLRDDIKGLREGDIKELQQGLNSKVNSGTFWAGVTILIAVVALGVAILAWLMPNPFST